MSVTVIKNAKLHVISEEFAGQDSLAIMDHRIVPLESRFLEDGTAEEIDVEGMHVCPGFIDLLVNGCDGVNFSQTLSVESLDQIRRWQTINGTTTFVPTIVSGPRENLSRALAAVAEFKSNHPTVCPGLHLEGPFINANHKGFQPSGYIRSFTKQDLDFLCHNVDAIAYMTIAPETISPQNIIELLSNHIKLSIGHTATSYFYAKKAFKAGIKNVTHLFNAMRPISGREPGIIGAVLDDEEVYAGIIADGRHVHPALVNLAHRSLKERMYIVSDSQAVAGMSRAPSSFSVSGTEIFVDQKRGLIDSRGAYAGTTICMFDGVKFLVKECGFDLEEALIAATYAPAHALGLQECGIIEGGNIADLVIFDDNFKIQYVVQNGFVKPISEFS